MTATAPTIPVLDARNQDAITPAQAEAFRQSGLMIIRNLVRGAGLSALRAETLPLVERAVAGCDDPDYFYKDHEQTGTRTPYRVEYVVDKTAAAKALLAHPFILRSVEILQGRNFIPTWDSMVFKNAGMGAAIPWHRDSGDQHGDPRWPIFNVDIYLDRADQHNGVWGIPGSNRWSAQRAQATITELNAGMATGVFSTAHGAVPVAMEPGDVLFHDILVLHGSAAVRSELRRVIYLEFRPGEIELACGPHVPGYLPRKQQVLAECLRRRSFPGETPFIYRPTGSFADFPTDAPPTFRYPHHDWWRTA